MCPQVNSNPKSKRPISSVEHEARPKAASRGWSSYECPKTLGTANAFPGNSDRVKPTGIASANSCGGNSNLFAVTGNANQFDRSRGGTGDPRRLRLFGASHERNTAIRGFASRSDSRRPSVGLAPEKPRLYWGLGDTFPRWASGSPIEFDPAKPLMVVRQIRQAASTFFEPFSRAPSVR
jgi:hypothetical protein